MGDTLAGRRILVVEDEYFIAMDISRLLEREGAIVVGPTGNLPAGLTLAEEPLDAAVLDVNLETALSYPIADRLRERGIPYLFLTGYDGWSLPSDYRGNPCLAKPFAPKTVLEVVRAMLAPKPETV